MLWLRYITVPLRCATWRRVKGLLKVSILAFPLLWILLPGNQHLHPPLWTSKYFVYFSRHAMLYVKWQLKMLPAYCTIVDIQMIMQRMLWCALSWCHARNVVFLVNILCVFHLLPATISWICNLQANALAPYLQFDTLEEYKVISPSCLFVCFKSW